MDVERKTAHPVAVAVGRAKIVNVVQVDELLVSEVLQKQTGNEVQMAGEGTCAASTANHSKIIGNAKCEQSSTMCM